jgi:hypothetical protein
MRDLSTVCILPSLARTCWIIVILSVVTVFLMPSGFGPYSAVNGPTTVFKSIQYADAVKAAASSTVLLGIRPLVSMIHVVGIASSSASGSAWIDILEKYCVRLC